MVHILPVKTKDLDFVYTCISILEDQQFDKKVFEKIYLTNLNADGVFMFLIGKGNTLIGYMSIHVQNLLHHCGPVAEIQELVVLPEYRNEGAGKVAIDFALKFSKEKQCMLLELSSNLRREDAHRFYLSNGFRQSHYKFTMEL